MPSRSAGPCGRNPRSGCAAIVAVLPDEAPVTRPVHIHALADAERGRGQRPSGENVRWLMHPQAGDAMSHAAGGALEDGYIVDALPVVAGPAGGGDGCAVGRHRHRIKFAFVAGAMRRAQDLQQPAAGELPHAYGLSSEDVTTKRFLASTEMRRIMAV